MNETDNEEIAPKPSAEDEKEFVGRRRKKKEDLKPWEEDEDPDGNDDVPVAHEKGSEI